MKPFAWLGLAAAAFAQAALAAPPLEAYGRLPAIEMMELSPSGQRLAFVAVIKEERRFHISQIGGKPIGAGAIGPLKVRSLDWAGDDHLMVFFSQTERVFFGDISREWPTALHVNVGNASNPEAWPVFAKPKMFPAIFGYPGAVQQGGRWFGYFGGVPMGRTGDGSEILKQSHPDLFRVDLTTRQISLAAGGSENTEDWVIDPRGEVLASSTYDDRNGRWKLLRGNRGQALIDAPISDVEHELLGLGRTAETVLVSRYDASGGAILETPLAGGEPQKVWDADEVDAILRHRLTGLAIGALTYDAAGAAFLDAAAQRRFDAARKAFPGSRVRLASYSADFNRLVVSVDGPKDAGSYWLVDIPTGKATVLGDIYPDIKPADVGPMRMFAYKAADGLAMEGVLTLPPGREAKGLPLVVLPHGGPIVGGDQAGFDWWAQAFASRGYAVFQPNYRGTLGYGADFVRAARGQFGRKMQTDISDGVAALAKEGLVDPKRACIVGASYGGYAALAGVTVQQGLYRCAVSVSGVSDAPRMIAWLRNRKLADKRATGFWRALTRDPTGESEAASISPLRNAGRADAPILLIHGKDDSVVPLEQSQQMARALKDADKPSELMVLAGEDHWLSREATRVEMLKASVAFVEKHNPAP